MRLVSGGQRCRSLKRRRPTTPAVWQTRRSPRKGMGRRWRTAFAAAARARGRSSVVLWAMTARRADLTWGPAIGAPGRGRRDRFADDGRGRPGRPARRSIRAAALGRSLSLIPRGDAPDASTTLTTPRRGAWKVGVSPTLNRSCEDEPVGSAGRRGRAPASRGTAAAPGPARRTRGAPARASARESRSAPLSSTRSSPPRGPRSRRRAATSGGASQAWPGRRLCPRRPGRPRARGLRPRSGGSCACLGSRRSVRTPLLRGASMSSRALFKTQRRF